MKQCEICGVTNNKVCGKTGRFKMDLCSKHWTQMAKHGAIIEKSWRNTFTDDGMVAEITINNKGTQYKTQIDSEDINKINMHTWHLANDGYVKARCGDKTIIIHRLIIDCPHDMLVDHINHNTLDNRKGNLRICNKQQNRYNAKRQANNKSGITGVYWSDFEKKWVAQIRVNGKSTRLGGFKDINDAIAARKEAEVKYFGEFRYIQEEAI